MQAALLGASVTAFLDERLPPAGPAAPAAAAAAAASDRADGDAARLRGDRDGAAEGSRAGERSGLAHDQLNAAVEAVVVCGDFNSVPFTQHEFLNRRAKEMLNQYTHVVSLDARGAGRDNAGVSGGAGLAAAEDAGQAGRDATRDISGSPETGADVGIDGPGTPEASVAGGDEAGIGTSVHDAEESWRGEEGEEEEDDDDDPGIEDEASEHEEAAAYALLGNGTGELDASDAATEALPSAVWALMAEGRAPASHPEHPATFGSSLRLPDLRTGLPPLKHAYAARGATMPAITTKTNTFAGCIDHIWLSQDLQVVEVLDMPYPIGAHADFRPIPDARWGSDHLAVGVTLRF